MTALGPTAGPPERGRRAFLGALAGALLLPARQTARQSAQDSLAGGPSGRLWDPARAGRPLEPVAAVDNDAAIQAIEKRLRCTCGCNLDVYTCRTTDFTCTTSPAMHRQVVALAAQGKNAREIIDAFVRESGVAILMAPPRRGFNLAGYFVPSVAIIVAGVVLGLALRRWTRGAAAAPPRVAAAPEATPEELERLRRELEQFTD